MVTRFSRVFKVNSILLVGQETRAVNPGVSQTFWDGWQVCNLFCVIQMLSITDVGKITETFQLLFEHFTMLDHTRQRFGQQPKIIVM